MNWETLHVRPYLYEKCTRGALFPGRRQLFLGSALRFVDDITLMDVLSDFSR